MSIALQAEVDALKRRVALLEEALVNIEVLLTKQVWDSSVVSIEPGEKQVVAGFTKAKRA